MGQLPSYLVHAGASSFLVAGLFTNRRCGASVASAAVGVRRVWHDSHLVTGSSLVKRFSELLVHGHAHVGVVQTGSRGRLTRRSQASSCSTVSTLRRSGPRILQHLVGQIGEIQHADPALRRICRGEPMALAVIAGGGETLEVGLPVIAC